MKNGMICMYILSLLLILSSCEKETITRTTSPISESYPPVAKNITPVPSATLSAVPEVVGSGTTDSINVLPLVASGCTASVGGKWPLQGKEAIIIDEAITKCTNDMKEPIMFSCYSEKDVVGIKNFSEILKKKGDHSYEVRNIMGKFSNGYLGHYSHSLDAVKYFDGGYMFLFHSPQHTATDNIILEYRKIHPNGKAVDVYFDYFSRCLDREHPAYIHYGENDTPLTSENYFSVLTKEFASSKITDAKVEKFYEFLSKEFVSGRFSDPKVQTYYDNFMANIKAGIGKN